ncbi:CD209 antigen-like protein E [Triplophysa rosa]|uniref:CD209 antigen-like protein E n=1 Tax=Triplophysa rosa TaxID=992332 RepID=UPI002546139B|nr:CD209 antigen-like protein E [Triplophysa rosa]
MSENIYHNVDIPETLDKGEIVEMTVDIYESSDSVRNHERQQALQHTEREQLLTNNSKLLEEKDQCLLNTRRLSEERDQSMKERKELKGWLTDNDQRSDDFKWIYNNFSFYYFSTVSNSWSDSREDCKQREADLVIINSKEEQEAFQKATGSEFWIGLSKEKGVWKWVDGTAVTARYCMNGFPRYNSQNCALTSSSGWSDHSCKEKHFHICEKRIFTQK